MLIRTITAEDLDAVAALHLASYHGDHFTSHLSRSQLRRYYGEVVRINPFSYIALSEDQQPLGFVVGGLHTGNAISNFVRHNFLGLIAVSIRNTRFLFRRIAGKFRPVSRRVASRAQLRLLSIAVDPHKQSKGTGHALLQHFEQSLLSHGITEYGLSVHLSNVRAVSFYELEGFQVEFETADARYYFKNLSVPIDLPLESIPLPKCK